METVENGNIFFILEISIDSGRIRRRWPVQTASSSWGKCLLHRQTILALITFMDYSYPGKTEKVSFLPLKRREYPFSGSSFQERVMFLGGSFSG